MSLANNIKKSYFLQRISYSWQLTHIWRKYVFVGLPSMCVNTYLGPSPTFESGPDLLIKVEETCHTCSRGKSFLTLGPRHVVAPRRPPHRADLETGTETWNALMQEIGEPGIWYRNIYNKNIFFKIFFWLMISCIFQCKYVYIIRYSCHGWYSTK